MSESNLKIEKIQKSSNVAAVLARIAKIFAIVMSVLLLIVSVVIIGLKEYVNQEFQTAFESGIISKEEINSYTSNYEMLLTLVEDGNIAVTLGTYLITVSVMLICLAVIMHFVGKLFQGIRESYSPFKPEIVKNLKVAFVLITLLCLSNSLLIGVVIGFSLWCVIHIFEYGCELQRQSDETL